MSTFDAVEILAEFSKAIRHGLIALEGLHDLDGVDPAKVTALTDCVRHRLPRGRDRHLPALRRRVCGPDPLRPLPRTPLRSLVPQKRWPWRSAILLTPLQDESVSAGLIPAFVYRRYACSDHERTRRSKQNLSWISRLHFFRQLESKCDADCRPFAGITDLYSRESTLDRKPKKRLLGVRRHRANFTRSIDLDCGFHFSRHVTLPCEFGISRQG